MRLAIFGAGMVIAASINPEMWSGRGPEVGIGLVIFAILDLFDYLFSKK